MFILHFQAKVFRRKTFAWNSFFISIFALLPWMKITMTVLHVPKPPALPLVLASTSPFRKTPLPNEPPATLVSRLAELKAHSAIKAYPQALIIGSDQVAVCGDTVLGKPGTHEQAIKQLTITRGKQVDFLTGLCLLNTDTNQAQTDVVRFSVKFRQLTLSQIENYLAMDKQWSVAIPPLS